MNPCRSGSAGQDHGVGVVGLQSSRRPRPPSLLEVSHSCHTFPRNDLPVPHPPFGNNSVEPRRSLPPNDSATETRPPLVGSDVETTDTLQTDRNRPLAIGAGHYATRAGIEPVSRARPASQRFVERRSHIWRNDIILNTSKGAPTMTRYLFHTIVFGISPTFPSIRTGSGRYAKCSGSRRNRSRSGISDS